MTATAPTTRDVSTPMLWVGSLVIVGIALCRAMTAHGRLAWWDLDATRVFLPETTITPAWSVILDAVVWLAVAVVGFALVKAEKRIALPAWGLVLVALGAVVYHGVFKVLPGGSMPSELAALEQRIGGSIQDTLGLAVDPGERVYGSFESLVRGSAWLAALVGGLALMLAVRADAALRRVAAAALLSLACVLVMKGGHQYFIEHAQTVADFEGNTEATLAAQGLQPGTPTAREFERRLRHPDATGWFGLSNVYGGVMAAMCVAALLIGRSLVRRIRIEGEFHGGLLPCIGFTLLALLGLLFANSRGALVAGMVGLIAALWILLSPGLARGRLGERLPRVLPLPLRPWLMPTRRHFGLVMLGVMALSFAAIIARGIIGEAIGELSLLFRWHYLIASVRIWLGSPLLGVGPGEFQSAYAAAKPAVNPEVIESPHSVFVDWISTLGIGGLCMGAVLGWMAWRIGVGAGRPAVEPIIDAEAETRRDRIALLLTIATAAGVSGYRQLVTTGGDEAIVRLLGIIGMLIAALLIARWLRVEPGARPIIRPAWIGLAGTAAVLLAHGQIEMVFTAPGASGWVLALLGVAAGGVTSGRARVKGGRSLALPIGGLLVAAGVGLLGWNALRWERELAGAAAAARPLTEVRAAVRALPTAEGRAEVDRLLGTIVEQVIPAAQPLDRATMEQLNGFIASYERSAQRAVAKRLLRAYLAEPSVPGPLRRAAGLWLAAGDVPRARAALGLVLIRFPDHSSSVASAAVLLEAIAEQTGERVDAEVAAAAWTRAHRLDPFAVRPAARLVGLETAHPGVVRALPEPRRGAPEHLDAASTSAAWARRALWNDEMLRLDPLKRMPDDERARLQGLAGEG